MRLTALPVRVKNGPDRIETSLPDYLEERTSSVSVGTSQNCQKRPHSASFDLLADAFANLTESCSYQKRSPRFAAFSMLNLLYRKSPVISLPTQSGNSSTRSSRSNSTSAITTPLRRPL